jgi:hypothetical protein
MNQQHAHLHIAELEAAQAGFARRVVVHLDEDAANISADVAERLRFARVRALERAQVARASSAAVHVGASSGGTALLGRPAAWLFRFASALPLVALVAGLAVIEHWQTRTQIAVAAEVDADLLSDDLPPNAYRDPGFLEFLKMPPRE